MSPSNLTEQIPVRSLAIVVPLFNVLETRGGKVLETTLQSIETSLGYFNQNYPQARAVTSEIVVVDDGSTDQTFDWMREYSQDKPTYQLFKLGKSLGAGGARNRGVRLSQAKAIFFCDGDDLFFTEHILLGMSVINRPVPESLSAKPEYIGFVRSGMHTKDFIHPDWQVRIENSSPLNLCVRREIHECVGGFPEGEFFRKYGGEDFIYSSLLNTFATQARISRKTVEYIRYPGSHFDQQLYKFQAPFGAVSTASSPEDAMNQNKMLRVLEERLEALRQLHSGFIRL